MLFETNRFDVLESIIAWCEDGAVEVKTAEVAGDVEIVGNVVTGKEALITVVEQEPVVTSIRFEALQEADDDLLIKTNR